MLEIRSISYSRLAYRRLARRPVEGGFVGLFRTEEAPQGGMTHG